MYISTFYSFKGGVGRTMALVNVAVDLARRGKRVLVVDFDLEAPGLDTFDLPRPDGPTLGVVDFVRHYLQTKQAPDARAYLYESPDIGQDGGGLWIMPSGAPEETYSQRLSEIDWRDLYEQHDGYLLFEDLKLQWEQSINPDYVLIDSRTGHTDVGGICTRQLPHAVVVLFFPNEQNLRGLTKVVRDIRAEETGPREKMITLHFVMSNVPDIDDEDQILARILKSFAVELDFEDDPMVIHRYQSLSLLNQSIFTMDRPQSRLAIEYRTLVEAIRFYNIGDRDSALKHIRSLRSEYDRIDRTPLDRESIVLLHDIEDTHSNDGEVLFELGRLYDILDDPVEAKTLFDQSIALKYTCPEVYISRMNVWLSDYNDHDKAVQDALRAIEFTEISVDHFDDALELLKESPTHLERVIECRAIKSMSIDGRIHVARNLNEQVLHARLSSDILLSILSTQGLSLEQLLAARDALIPASMALGRYTDVIDLIAAQGAEISGESIDYAFHLGMATWGVSNSIDPEYFERVLESRDTELADDSQPGLLQRIAISHWAVGEIDEAMRLARGIRRMSKESWHFRFSFWRYLDVTSKEFEQDIDELIALVGGDSGVKPRFMLPQDSPTLRLQ